MLSDHDNGIHQYQSGCFGFFLIILISNIVNLDALILLVLHSVHGEDVLRCGHFGILVSLSPKGFADAMVIQCEL